MHDTDKRLAARAAVAEVRSGMIVGLGTGSTAAFAIEALGEHVRAGLAINAVATSLATEAHARSVGVKLIDLPARIDLTIDGADEIDGDLRAIKGAGGAMLREKIVAAASDRMIVIADGSKRVAAIGAADIPVEVLPFALDYAAARLAELGGAPVLRPDFLTDQGNRIFDCRFFAGHRPSQARRENLRDSGGFGAWRVPRRSRCRLYRGRWRRYAAGTRARQRLQRRATLTTRTR